MTHTDNWLLKLKAVKHADAVLHLAAAEEYRNNFPLHNIKSAGGKSKEFHLPGVHSDVGGSYRDGESDSGKVVCHGNYASVRADYNNLIEQGWYKADDLELEITARDEFNNLRSKRRAG